MSAGKVRQPPLEIMPPATGGGGPPSPRPFWSGKKKIMEELGQSLTNTLEKMRKYMQAAAGRELRHDRHKY